MGRRRDARPCWVVLAPADPGAVKRTLAAVLGTTQGELDVLPGFRDHTAIVEYQPHNICSGEEELAKTLSRGAAKPAYVLWLEEHTPRVQVFADGEYAGEVHTWPDTVAAQLGCSFPDMLPAKGWVDLTPRKSPDAQPGDLRLVGWTIAQWQHGFEHEADWDLLMDAAEPHDTVAILAALTHSDAPVRSVAARLAGVLNRYALGEHADRALSVLRTVAEGDADPAIRGLAAIAREHIVDMLDLEMVTSEAPWMHSYRPEHFPAALAALDDPRLPFVRWVCAWWASMSPPPATKAKALATIEARLAREPDARTRGTLEHARTRLHRR